MKNADVREDAGEKEATTADGWHVEDVSITEQLMSWQPMVKISCLQALTLTWLTTDAVLIQPKSENKDVGKM